MKIFVGCDHAAFREKETLKEAYSESSFEIVDCGTLSPERCDYPDYARIVAKHVQKGEGKGLLLCGSGLGVSMAANRYAGVRAALCRTPEEARLSVEHNDSNILCVGARISSLEEIKMILKTWLGASFEGGRHIGRIAKFSDLGERF